MMRASAKAATEAAETLKMPRPLVIAVTVLTSMDNDDLNAVGQQGPISDQVIRLARLTQDSGLDGVVCSPQEAAGVRAACGPDFKLIVPGIRPSLSLSNDQKRTSSPSEAVNAGADYLVIGRPITKAPDPAAVNLKLDPGLAFGTGTHETTALCLQWLDSTDLHNKTVLDFGCGSGVLAIAALLLGAGDTTGTDIDPQALIASHDNAHNNGVAESLTLFLPEQMPQDYQCDILVANILAGPLVELS